MRGSDSGVLGPHFVDGVCARLRREQGGNYAHGAAGIVDVDCLPAPVIRMDFYRGVHTAGGSSANEQRDLETLALHLVGDVAHLVE